MTVKSQRKRQVIDLTTQIDGLIPRGFSGIVVIAALHTTVAMTTADLDPGTDLDLLDALDLIVPERPWRHPHNPEHAPDHLLASIVGASVTLPVRDGRLVTGTWQRVIMIDFDGPRDRQLKLTLIKS